MTELEAVQRIMEGAGMAPASATDQGGPAGDALRVLRRTSKDIQSRGWHFNTEDDVTLTPDGSDNIVIDSDAIRVDTYGASRHLDVAMRGRMLYDRCNNVDTFESAVQATIVRLFAFDCVPEPVAEYIAAEAAVRFASSRPSMRNANNDLYRQHRAAKSSAERHEREQSDRNLFDTREARGMLGDRRRRNVL